MLPKRLLFSLGSCAIVVLANAAPALADLPITTIATFHYTGSTGGSHPSGALALLGNTLYGTTQNGGIFNAGTAFSVPITGGAPATLTQFTETPSVQVPFGGVILSGTTLYGTSTGGGTSNAGTVFSLPITGGTPTLLASFNGTTGNGPWGGLTLSGNQLYGTTSSGPGANGMGTVFSVPVTGGAPAVLASFSGNNGAFPTYGNLTLAGNTLYGTTTQGGANNVGVVYSVPVAGGTPTVLASFNGANGKTPQASLTLSADGQTLYGTTQLGGANNDGVVFSVPITGGTPTVLASLTGANGMEPYDAPLILIGGILYGTALQGGAFSNGTIFSIPAAGGTLTVLASFDGINEAAPDSALLLSGNTLYGETEYGGFGDGTVYSITLPVPEPASLTLIAIGAAGLLMRRRKA